MNLNKKIFFLLIFVISAISYCKSGSNKELQDQYATIILKQTDDKAMIQGMGASDEQATSRAEGRAKQLFDYFKLFKETSCKLDTKTGYNTCTIFAEKIAPTVADKKERTDEERSIFDEYNKY